MAYLLHEHREPSDLSYHLVPTDGDVEKVSLIDVTSDNAPGLKGTILTFGCGRPIKNAFVPTKFRTTAKRKVLHQFFVATGAGIVVSGIFKKIVERFEPETHQFFPIDLVSKNGEELEKMFMMVICNRLDTIDPGRTSFIFKSNYAWINWDDSNPNDAEEKKHRKIILDSTKFCNHHLWVEKHLLSDNFYVTEALGNALKAANIFGLGMKIIEETGADQ